MRFLLKNKENYKLHEDVLSNYGCYLISNYFEIHVNGDISLCCYTWLPIYCGNILKDSPEEIINNSKRLSLINDMQQGKFTECNDYCPFLSTILNGEKLWPGYVGPISKLEQEKYLRPITVNFSYDVSCNLECPSCRKSLIIHPLNENEKLVKIHEKVKLFVEYLLSIGKKLLFNISGSSDAFASPTFWNYLKELAMNPNKNIQLKIITNGTLMNEGRLNEIESLWNSLIQVTVSVDAATENTYNVVRKNGSFSKLKNNLEHLNYLINQGNFVNLKTYMVHFTVQKRNFREIKDFAKWMLGYNKVNIIFFSMVAQWGHISNIEYENSFLLNQHEKEELSEILKDPIFKNNRIITGNLNSIKLYESH